jgi:putative methionine-R-sulfoxide reductase with GAF domain
MDSHSILDHDGEVPESNPPDSQASVRFPGEDGGRSLAEMAERDLAATLQLLAERAQYITGATGAAIALRDHEEMVCRASAGTSAPEVGTQLQVNSGLSGESVRTRQTLRCDDASTDTRVNRESCEALGISSVVVMPLLRGDEVIGVFELFSNQANVFETRDIAALERMGAMVHAALEHSAASLGLDPLPAEQATHPSLPVSGNGHHGEESGTTYGDSVVESTLAFSQDDDLMMEHAPALEEPSTSSALASSGITFHMRTPPQAPPATAAEQIAAPPAPPVEVPPQAGEESDILEDPLELVAQTTVDDEADDILSEEPRASFPVTAAAPDLQAAPEPAMVEITATAVETPTPPEAPASQGAVASLRKCEACGFPVSEGRRLCLDCEKKGAAPPPKPVPPAAPEPTVSTLSSDDDMDASSGPMPNFLVGGAPEESWIATHKLVVLAIIIGVIAIVAAAMLR